MKLKVGDDGRLYQLGYGPLDQPGADGETPPREDEYYPPAGNGFILEPALQVVHADGNTSTDLSYAAHEVGKVGANVTITRIQLHDPAYPFLVTLCFKAFEAEDVIEQWAEIRHEEPAPVVLSRFASSAPVVKAQSYWLSQFHGDHMREAELSEERLTAGIKVLDSKLGVRAHQMRNPSFVLSIDGPAEEETGAVLGGTLAWSGSFQFAFEIDWNLGDREVNKQKLPRGLSHLADEANRRGVAFGIWLEPEMVNPASQLFDEHPDWVIRQPHRELLLGRNQLTLDLTRPEVREFTWQVIDDRLRPNPGIHYVKWDGNRFVTQPGSPYLPPEEQSHLVIDYQWALYEVMARMAGKYPNVMAMLCSGGSGRTDYAALQHFHSFWPSDNTDPMQRIYIQWGFNHLFPANAISAHVTDMGDRPPKLATDVALCGALVVDRDVQKMSAHERQSVTAAVAHYKERLRDLIAQADLYRLESPYERPRCALNYVSPDRAGAVLFIYQLRESAMPPVKPRGLHPVKRYRVREINVPEGGKSRLSLHDQVVDGVTLMVAGVIFLLHRVLESAVVEFVEE